MFKNLKISKHSDNMAMQKFHKIVNSLRLSDAFICVNKLTIIGSDNGLSLGRHQANIWTNSRILVIGPLGTNFIQILIKIHTLSFKKMYLKMSSGTWRPFCLSLSVVNVNLASNEIVLGEEEGNFLDKYVEIFVLITQ